MRTGAQLSAIISGSPLAVGVIGQHLGIFELVCVIVNMSCILQNEEDHKKKAGNHCKLK